MRKTIIVTVMLFTLLYVGQAVGVESGGYFESGSRLNGRMQADNRVLERKANGGDGIDSGYVLGYIMGVTDTLLSLKVLCLPESVKKGQIVDVVKKYLKDHLEQRHYSGVDLVAEALTPTSSCKGRAR